MERKEHYIMKIKELIKELEDWDEEDMELEVEFL